MRHKCYLPPLGTENIDTEHKRANETILTSERAG